MFCDIELLLRKRYYAHRSLMISNGAVSYRFFRMKCLREVLLQEVWL